MKVGILTLPLHDNYGGLLQAYALQIALTGLGHDVTVLRHRGLKARSVRQMIGQWVPGCLPVRLNNGTRCMLATRRKALKKISQNMRSFVEEQIQLTDVEYGEHNLAKLNNAGYDAFIVGSDQVWRPDYAGNIQAYFFSFIDNPSIRKIAYAASFGAAEWEFSSEETADCAQLLSSFNGVSVRESNAVDWCETKFQCDVDLVLDPTLLLGGEHYKKFVTRPREGTYLCSYILDPAQNLNRAIDEYASTHGFSRISPMPESQYTNVGEAGLDRCIYPSMNDWLSAFYYSDVVITDSFHGTVFAVMFNKPFLTVMNKGRGAPRFESFLGKLGLLSRLVDSVENVDEVLANLPEIDWSLVDGKLEAWRQRSLDFLDQNLPS
jgi:hypothetical protein